PRTAMGSMPRRLAACSALLALLPTAALAASQPRSWAQAQISLVTRQGLFASTPATFDADAPLTEGALEDALGRLTAGGVVPVDGVGAVWRERLDGPLAASLDLTDSAYTFSRAARTAGLDPPPRFGTEVVARLLGLRLNHPAGHDDLELQPQQPATRA